MKGIVLLMFLFTLSVQNQDSSNGAEFSSKVPIQMVDGYTIQRNLSPVIGGFPYYQIKIGNSIASASFCALRNANYQGDLVFNLNKEHQVVDIDLKTVPTVHGHCDPSFTDSFTLNITTKLHTSILAKSPIIEIVEQKAATKTEEEQSTSWISKYWLYIAIFALVVINSFVSSPAPPAASQNNRRPQ